MGLNWMGLGFSFGAKDTGLAPLLVNLNTQFNLLNTTLQSLAATSRQALTPSESVAEGVSQQLDAASKQFDLFASSAAEAGSSAQQSVRQVAEQISLFEDVADNSLKRVGENLDLFGEKWTAKTADTGGLDLGSSAKRAAQDVAGVTEAVGDYTESTSEGITGTGRMANSILSGAGKITGAFGWVGMALGPIIAGFGSITETSGEVADSVTGFAGRVGNQLHRLTTEGINLTNSLEGEAVGLGQTARQVGVNLGYTGDRLRRFIGQSTGMAMSLNIGADEAARAIRAWDESAETLGATGLRSAQDVARLTAGLGINADMLRNSTLEMRNLGASSDQIHLMTSAFAQLGRDVGDVSGSLNQLPQIMQMLEQRRALGETPEQMTAFATDTAAAARGLFAFTQDSGRAMDMASQLASTVTESRTAFQNMFAGAEQALPQLVTELSVVSGDVDQAFQLMQAGPGGLIEGMGQLVQTTRQQGGDVDRVLEFMRGRLQQVFGAEMTGTLVNFWRTMDGNTRTAMQSIRGASVDLGAMGREAHSTGRTLDEVFERMRAGFQTAFRRIARPAVRDFVRSTGRELQRLRRSINLAANSGGALGTVMETLSLSSQIGGLALLPRDLRSSAVAADELYGMVTPLITAFTTWGGLVDTIGTYIALFVTRVIEAKTETNTWSDAIDQVATDFSAIFVRWLGDAEQFLIQLTEGFANFNWDNLFGGRGQKGTLAGAFQNVLSRLRDIDWGRIWGNLQEGFNELFDRVSPWLEQKWDQLKAILRQLVRDWWDSIDWAAVIGDLRDLGQALREAIRPALSQAQTDVQGWFSEHWSEIVMGIMAVISASMAALLAGLAVAAAAFFFGPLIAQIVVLWAGLTEVWERWGDDISAFFSSWWESISEFPQEFGLLFQTVWVDLSDWFKELWEGIADFFGGVWGGLQETWQEVSDFFVEVWGGIASWFQDVGEDTVETFTAQWDRISAIPERVVGLIQSLWQGYIDWFVTTFPQTAQALEEVGAVWQERFDRMKKTAEEVWDSIAAKVLAAVDWVSEAIGDIRDALSEAGTRMLAAIRRVLDSIVDRFERARDSVLAVWGRVRDGIAEALSYVRTTIFDPFIDSITSRFDDVRDVVAVVWDSISGVISTAITYLRGNYIDPFLGAMESGWTSIRDTAASVWTTITDIATTVGETLVGVPGRLREAWEGIIGFFGTVFQRISETVQNALPSFNDLATGATRALDGIMATVIRLFGHSVHTVVGADMAATEEVMTATALRVSETMERVLHDATVEAIVTGFAEGFDAVAENMDEFASTMVDRFADLAERILEITTELFTAVVAQAEITMIALETAVESIIGRLRTITEAQAALAESSRASVESLARPDDEEAMRRRLAEIGGNDVLRAIHYPDWYAGPGEDAYKRLFVREMRMLHAAVVALGTASPTTGTEARRQLMQEARAAIGPARTGHPALPGGARRQP